MLELIYINFPVQREGNSQNDRKEKEPKQYKIKRSPPRTACKVVAHMMAKR